MDLRFVAGVLAVLLLVACDPAPPEPPDAGGTTDARTVCGADSDCDDGLYCDGDETCDPEDADADDEGCVAGTPPCAAADCDEASASCDGECDTDADGDGALAQSCGGSDCDDDDPNRYPGNAEVCDAANHDEDCEPRTFGVVDADADTYADAACCNADGTTMRCGVDCDDTSAGVHPGLAESCDMRDNDCDGATDEGTQLVFYRDQDEDLYGDPDDSVTACSPPAGYVLGSGDCDDELPDVHPTALEDCDGAIDHDCDGAIDDGCMCINGEMRVCGEIPMEAGICRRGNQECTMNTWGACVGYVPARAEECNELMEDEDCDGLVDEGVMGRCYPDPDGDGYAAAGLTGTLRCSCSSAETSRDPATGADCAPTDAAIHPGASELCDGVDSDCDGYAEDADADGHVAIGAPCSGGPRPADDCNDEQAAIHPGQTCFQERPVCLSAGYAPCLFRNIWTCGVPGVDDACVGPVCGSAACVTWDYDCSGTAERRPTVPSGSCVPSPPFGWSCPAAPPTCNVAPTTCVGPDGPPSDYVSEGPIDDASCGGPVSWRSCVVDCTSPCSELDQIWMATPGEIPPGHMPCR